VIRSPSSTGSCFENRARYVVSESGLLVYVPADRSRGEQRIFRIDLNGSTAELTSERSGFSGPTVSPDGRRIAFRSERSGATGIWVLDAETGAADRLTRGRSDAYPVWSLRGDSVLYGQGYRIQAIAVSGGEPRTVLDLDPSQSMPWPHGWSPEGSDLVYSAVGTETMGDALRFRVDDGSEFLVRGPTPDWGASLSPDGSRLAYVSGPSVADMVLYVANYPDARGRIPIAGPGAIDPSWGSAERLFFIEGRELVAVAIAPDGNVVPDSRRVLYRYLREVPPMANWLGVYPGGDAVVAVVPEPVERPEVLVVTNWLDQVRRQMGR